MVEVEGARRSCRPAWPGEPGHDSLAPRSESAERSRRTILEMLDSAVDLSQAPEIQKFMQEYRAEPARFPEAERREFPVLDDNPMYLRDYCKCILVLALRAGVRR